MHAQAACNLLTTLSYPPWEESLHREVYMTRGGEKRIPFHRYVEPSIASPGASSMRHSADAWPFVQLPPELQLRILATCSANTLFQFMHVSSRIRVEASKLFWAQQDAYFLIEAYWLLDGAYPGQTSIDLAPLAYIQQVEIECPPSISSCICPRPDGQLVVYDNTIAAFWATLKHRCPNVKMVVLNYNGQDSAREDDEEPFALVLRLLLQACPPDIQCSALYLAKQTQYKHIRGPLLATNGRAWRRTSFQRATEGHGWNESNPDRHRQTILLPPKPFHGPVGTFNQLKYECYQKIPLQRFGLWPLMVEALDRHYFGEGRSESFLCPLPGCATYFTQAGAWSVHAAEIHFREWSAILDVLPRKVGAMFAARNLAIDSRVKHIQEQQIKLQDTWRVASKIKRQAIQHSWMEQLNSDSAWATRNQGEDSHLWHDFMWHMELA